jgi:pimeloyl-ACP methyl ester carboxylesterase
MNAHCRYQCAVILAIALGLVACATTPANKPSSLASAVAEADAALSYRPISLATYNAAVREICVELANSDPRDSASKLKTLGVLLVLPRSSLPLRSIEISVPPRPGPREKAGIPVVLRYETKNAPLYPPEGLFVDACVLYERDSGEARVEIQTQADHIVLVGKRFQIAENPIGAGDQLKERAKRLAKSGFMSMIRPAAMQRKPQIYLLDPYDPNKTPLLMVHGLQSTPVAFATLVNALRSDPEIRRNYQIWQFYYATGTPVLANALALRESLDKTVRMLDPQDRDTASKRIVVLGHSMGGVISHTLVSSSGDRVWKSVFRVPPDQLKGDSQAIRELERILYFRRNPRVALVIFMAAPHRGSPMSESLVGGLGNALSRLPPMEERGFSGLASANPEAMMAGAAKFYAGGRFSAVRTLSPKSTALIALSKLPIEVPFHSIIGQQNPGPKERGSDGVVPYWSSHLEGAASERIVRGGHGVIGNAEAIDEVIQILHRAAWGKAAFPRTTMKCTLRKSKQRQTTTKKSRTAPIAIWWSVYESSTL